MTVNDFINLLDFEENDYFYHITGNGKSSSILEEGLLVNGTNIIDTNNILYTTCTPLNPEDIVDEDTFNNDLLDSEIGNNRFRDTNEMVIIGVPKYKDKKIVDEFMQDIDGVFYEGIIYNSYIMGYFNNEHEFTPNEEFEYGPDDFYEEHNFSK